MPVAAAKVALPIIRTGIKIKQKRCEGHPFKNVCMLTSVIIIPPAHQWFKVVKREKTLPQIFREDQAITLSVIDETLGTKGVAAFEKRIIPRIMGKSK